MTNLALSLGPRAKVALLLALAVAVSLMTSWRTLLPAVAIGLLAVQKAGMPLPVLLRRLAWLAFLAGGLFVTLSLAVPGPPAIEIRLGWLHLSGSQAGLALAGLTSLRMLASFLGALALAASTSVPELLQALAGLGVPRFFLALAGMAVRYIAVLRDEAQRQLIGRRSRCYRPAGVLWHPGTLRSAAQTLGMLLLRAYDRSERIYLAMMSRGYHSEHANVASEPLSGGERWTLVATVALAAGLVLLDRQMRGG